MAAPWSVQAAYEEDWVTDYQAQPGDYSIAVIPDIQELSARWKLAVTYGDVDANQIHNASDALYILQDAVGKREPFPCEG